MAGPKIGCCAKNVLLKEVNRKQLDVLAVAIKALKEINTPESLKALEEMRKLYPGVC